MTPTSPAATEGQGWRGDRTLPWTFIPFLMLAAVFIGEVLPVVIAIFGGEFGAYGAKEPIIKTLPDFGILLIIYTVLGALFWLLYRFANWRLVALCAFVLAYVLERWVYSHPEGEVGLTNLVSFGTVLQFVIIYFLVLVLPYLLFQAIRHKWAGRGIVTAYAVLFTLSGLGLGFTYITMVQRGLWPWRPVTGPDQSSEQRSSTSTPLLPATTCPDRLVETVGDSPQSSTSAAYLSGTTYNVDAGTYDWVRDHCPGVMERIDLHGSGA